jgi:hypothetical protein
MDYLFVVSSLVVIAIPAFGFSKIGKGVGENPVVYVIIGLILGMIILQVTSNIFLALFPKKSGAPAAGWYLIPFVVAVGIDLLAIRVVRRAHASRTKLHADREAKTKEQNLNSKGRKRKR